MAPGNISPPISDAGPNPRQGLSFARFPDNANDPNAVCVTKAQLAALLSAAATPTASKSVSSSASNSRDASAQNPLPDLTNSGNPDDANPSPAAQPPVIKIKGDNPAHVSVGATYQDLGATLTGPQADLNLGIKTFLNGALVSEIVLDTTEAATDTIEYVVADPTGLTATSTRTILIKPATAPSAPTATSTRAATTSLPVVDAPPLVPDYPATTTLPSAASPLPTRP